MDKKSLGQFEPVLSVNKVYADIFDNKGDQKRLLHPITFELQPGKVIGLAGESGSGKTMTCRSILQLLPSEIRNGGSIRLKNRELIGLPEHEMRQIRGKEIGYVVQNPMNALISVRTIGNQFIETIRTHLPLNKREAIELACHTLEQVNLYNPKLLLQKYPFELSGGMLQRVLIALTMCLSPSIVIADEPTTALDTENQFRVLEELEKLRSQGTAILFITHDLDVLAEIADEVMVMCSGELIEHTDVFTLFNSPQHPYTAKLLHNRLDQEWEVM
ncbi:ABC transporter ATP-binding protein [Lysinibacillus sp. NPDC093712]|uniref:ABC transporter ATP-binding protein n=1 Tax=Lysinibacillus sp. NPDC093712 TaxID=3390579 RepID=UPI003CFBC81D